MTQATLSRDIRELGLVKGGLMAPISAGQGRGERAYSQGTVAASIDLATRRIDRVQQLVLLRTGLGHAQSLCAALDSAELPDVVGTLAEKTRFSSSRQTRRARTLVRRLEEMSQG